MFKPFVIFVAIFILSSVILAQSNNPEDKFWEVLKPGMSEIQVKQFVGEPIKLESFTTVKYNSYDTSVYWRYPNNTVVVFTNHLLDRIEEDRDALLRYIQQHAFKKDKEGLVIVNHVSK